VTYVHVILTLPTLLGESEVGSFSGGLEQLKKEILAYGTSRTYVLS
jgi:hypothetical protein